MVPKIKKLTILCKGSYPSCILITAEIKKTTQSSQDAGFIDPGWGLCDFTVQLKLRTALLEGSYLSPTKPMQISSCQGGLVYQLCV